MIEAPMFNAAGARLKTPFALPADYFDGTVHQPVLHEAVKVFLNNQRQGTAKAKGRSEVSGGNQKPWKQKGTGRARQGSTRAPHWRGGGVVFGPLPRDYRTGIPRKVRQLARKSALNARAAEGRLLVVERVDFTEPKTSRMAELIDKLGFDGQKVLLLTNGIKPAAYLSARNLPRAEVLPWAEASAYDVLWADAVIVEQAALTGTEVEPSEGAELAEAPVAKKPAAKKPAKAPRQAKAAMKPAAKKPAARKPAAKKPKAKAAPKKKKGGK